MSRFQVGKDVPEFSNIKKAHPQWRDRLIAMFEGQQRIASADVTDHHQRAFGKWFDGAAGQPFKDLPIHGKIGTHHQEFRQMVAEMVDSWNRGQHAEAVDRFQHLAPHTDELFGILDLLTLEALKGNASTGAAV